MAAGLSAQQMRVTLEDITVSFSQEEWEYLDEGQKELYREVMKENYETLISLGYETINPDNLSRIKQEDELNVWDLQESGERAVTDSYPDNEATQEQNREKSLEEPPVGMEEIPRQSGNVWENISQETERRNTGTHQQESEKEQRDPAGDSPDGVTECEKNDKDLTDIPQHPRHRRSLAGHHHWTSNLKTHEMVHSGPKLPTCTKCNKSFISSSHLKTHQMIHSGLKPFTCTECNKSFVWSSHLKIHQMVHNRRTFKYQEIQSETKKMCQDTELFPIVLSATGLIKRNFLVHLINYLYT